MVASIPSAEELLDGQVRAEDIPVAEAEVSWTGDVVRQWMALAEEGTRVAEAWAFQRFALPAEVNIQRVEELVELWVSYAAESSAEVNIPSVVRLFSLPLEAGTRQVEE